MRYVQEYQYIELGEEPDLDRHVYAHVGWHQCLYVCARQCLCLCVGVLAFSTLYACTADHEYTQLCPYDCVYTNANAYGFACTYAHVDVHVLICAHTHVHLHIQL